MAGNPFTHHPHDVGESYAEHFGHASWFGVRMIGGGIACLLHAIFPFLFQTTGSRMLEKMYRRLTGRADRVNWERHPII